MGCLALVLLVVGGCSRDNPVAPVGDPNAGLELSAVQNCNGNPGIIPPNARPQGKSYAEWSVRWWQWLASAPLDHNPGLDETGADIGYGQSGAVWFLPPNFSGTATNRTGVVPSGTMLFVMLIGFETSTREGYGTTENELRSAARGIVDMVSDVSCEIDGAPVRNLNMYRVQSSRMFSLTVPNNNVFDLWGYPTPAGTYFPSVADGYYLMLAPLSEGQHTIHWHGAINDFGYFPDITYNLTVGHRPYDRHQNDQ
jgi:hypothetical protein